MVEVNENRRRALTGPFSAATLGRVTPEVAAALTRPVVIGAGLVALALVILVGGSVGALVTVAHEGGHMVVGILTGHKILYFEMDDADNAGTQPLTTRWGPGRILTAFAGYVTPPVVGLGGAVLLTAGKAWPLLWIAVVLLVLAWVKARGELATFVVLLLAVTIGYVALYGTPVLQAEFAAGMVWVLLFGGVRAALGSTTDNRSDAAKLAHDTLIPRIVWKGVFIVIALLCLLQGGERLLGI
jgi:Peptidase M50B-like